MQSLHPHLKRATWVAFLAGLSVFVLLIGYYGVVDVIAALAVAGASGLASIAAVHLVPLASESVGWGLLFDRAHRPRFRTLLWGRWIGEAVDTLLPVAQVGGNLVRIRLFMKLGLPATLVAATLVADTTLTVVTLIGFTLLGLIVLTSYVAADGLVLPLFLAMMVLSVLIGGFYVAQRRGLFGVLARFLQDFAGSLSADLVDGADAIDQETRRIYARRKDVLHSALWLAAAWALGTFEVWVALRLLGHPMSLLEAFVIESLVQGVRTSAFIIPGALGVQEGGFLLVGALLSLPADVALALALARRVRELAFGIPGILAWQWFEIRSHWHQQRRGADHSKVEPKRERQSLTLIDEDAAQPRQKRPSTFHLGS